MNEHTSTLNEILRLSFTQNYTWCSEIPTSVIRVNWVVTRIEDFEQGDVLLISGTDLEAKTLEKAQLKGGAAVIIVGDLPADAATFPPDFPVVSIHTSDNLRKVHRDLLNILLNQRVYFLEKGVQIHAQLSKLTAEGEGLAGLTRAISDLSGRGVLVQDKRLGILAEYPSSALLSIWEEVLVMLVEKTSLPEDLTDRKKAGREAFTLHQEIQEGLTRIITPISVSGVARGYLSLIETGQQLDTLDYLVVEQGALVCAIEMARVKAVREVEKRLKGDLLTALFQENITPRDAILWVQSMGMDLEQAHTAIRFAWDSPTPPSMRRLETLVNGEVARRGSKVLIEALGSEIACICQVSRSPGRPEEAISLANAVAENAHQEFPEARMRCGIGRPATDVRMWRDSFRQAGQALEMARRIQVKTPRYFPDLSVYRLLLQLEHHPDLQTFKDEILGSLLAYEGSRDLIRTLEVYFDHNGILSQASEALFIHRNTLIYRMERIADITGLDLDNTETRLAVQLALRIHHMVSGN